MPRPQALTPGPPRPISPAPNAVVGTATPRLEAALVRLPPWGLRCQFDIRQPPQQVPALADDYAYRLRFGSTVAIEAETEWGALAGLATIAQLGAGGGFAVRDVEDAPRFPWRGVMVDPARRFLSVDTLKRTLDAMWFYKLNVLHLHLTDDQGFRFPSLAFPELASATAYSRQDLRELVAYAADRGVRVVAELDMPGHTTSWLAAHPQWASAPVAASVRFGLHKTRLDPANPDWLHAVDTLLGELAEVFPDEFVHFGGDEAVGVPADAQALFAGHVVARLAALGKRAVGWDECLHPDLPPKPSAAGAREAPGGVVVQAWRGMNARDAALDAGFDCVVSAPYYLDLFYPAEAHYAFDPAECHAAAEVAMHDNPRLAHVRQGLEWMADFSQVPTLPQRPRGTVLGGEACMWGELVADELLATRVWSRLPAIAERFWGTADDGDPLPRLTATRRALAALGILPEDGVPAGVPAALTPLVEMLEPVKWYRRLMGEANFTRRVNGLGGDAEARPYNAATPLDRLVDRLPPESMASRRAEADLAAGRSMRRWIAGWRAQHEALDALPQWHEELGAASAALAAVADIVAGESDAAATPLAGPFGEYLLPVAYAVDAAR